MVFAGELRRSLPAIIVEILEERLETEQINTVASLADELFDSDGKLINATSSHGGTSSDDLNHGGDTGDSDSQVLIICDALPHSSYKNFWFKIPALKYFRNVGQGPTENENLARTWHTGFELVGSSRTPRTYVGAGVETNYWILLCILNSSGSVCVCVWVQV